MVLCFVYTDVIARVCEKVEHSIVSHTGRVYVYTAVYKPYSRPCTAVTRAVHTACTRRLRWCTWLCTPPVHSRERAMYTCARLCTYTAYVDDRLCTWLVYTARPCRLCTRPFTDRVQAVYMAVYTTWPCVHDRVHTVYTACTVRVR